jgi:protein-tyrosine phosphatase
MDSYRRIPYEIKHGYDSLFAHLVNGELPLVFGCTEGKDRAVIGAALVLSALGVSRDS